ncbi:MAG: hypothetical protein HYZ22_08505 [Chloroflexi bacterium]|nr:hypothetical protein [Chloroflexota bacterium]
MKHPLLRLTLLLAFLMTACYQEIQPNAAIPEVTSVMTSGPKPALQTAPAPATPTQIFFPAQALTAGPIHIIVIGDDFPHGDGDDDGRGYPVRLLELASQIRPGSTIVNFAQSGWTSDDLVAGEGELSSQLDMAVAEVESAFSQRRAAVVLVWVGGNDLWELYTGVTEVTVEQEEKDALRFSENIDEVLLSLRETGAEAIIARLDDQSQRPARRRSEVYPDITADELLRMSAQLQKYNEIISSKAEEYGVLTVDFYNSEIFVSDATLSADGFHPNSVGYDLIAQAWYKALIKILP